MMLLPELLTEYEMACVPVADPSDQCHEPFWFLRNRREDACGSFASSFGISRYDRNLLVHVVCFG